MDLEASEGRGGVGVEGGVDGVMEDRGGRHRGAVRIAAAEDELGHVGPDVAPAAGEEAGARGGCGGWEEEEDAVQDLVGEAADEVVRAAAAGGWRLHEEEGEANSGGGVIWSRPYPIGIWGVEQGSSPTARAPPCSVAGVGGSGGTWGGASGRGGGQGGEVRNLGSGSKV